MLWPEPQSGEVVRVLEDWELPPIDLWAAFPSGRLASAKARAFAEFVEHGDCVKCLVSDRSQEMERRLLDENSRRSTTELEARSGNNFRLRTENGLATFNILILIEAVVGEADSIG